MSTLERTIEIYTSSESDINSFNTFFKDVMELFSIFGNTLEGLSKFGVANELESLNAGYNSLREFQKDNGKTYQILAESATELINTFTQVTLQNTKANFENSIVESENILKKTKESRSEFDKSNSQYKTHLSKYQSATNQLNKMLTVKFFSVKEILKVKHKCEKMFKNMMDAKNNRRDKYEGLIEEEKGLGEDIKDNTNKILINIDSLLTGSKNIINSLIESFIKCANKKIKKYQERKEVVHSIDNLTDLKGLVKILNPNITEDTNSFQESLKDIPLEKILEFSINKSLRNINIILNFLYRFANYEMRFGRNLSEIANSKKYFTDVKKNKRISYEMFDKIMIYISALGDMHYTFGNKILKLIHHLKQVEILTREWNEEMEKFLSSKNLISEESTSMINEDETEKEGNKQDLNSFDKNFLLAIGSSGNENLTPMEKAFYFVKKDKDASIRYKNIKDKLMEQLKTSTIPNFLFAARSFFMERDSWVTDILRSIFKEYFNSSNEELGIFNAMKLYIDNKSLKVKVSSNEDAFNEDFKDTENKPENKKTEIYPSALTKAEMERIKKQQKIKKEKEREIEKEKEKEIEERNKDNEEGNKGNELLSRFVGEEEVNKYKNKNKGQDFLSFLMTEDTKKDNPTFIISLEENEEPTKQLEIDTEDKIAKIIDSEKNNTITTLDLTNIPVITIQKQNKEEKEKEEENVIYQVCFQDKDMKSFMVYIHGFSEERSRLNDVLQKIYTQMSVKKNKDPSILRFLVSEISKSGNKNRTEEILVNTRKNTITFKKLYKKTLNISSNMEFNQKTYNSEVIININTKFDLYFKFSNHENFDIFNYIIWKSRIGIKQIKNELKNKKGDKKSSKKTSLDAWVGMWSVDGLHPDKAKNLDKWVQSGYDMYIFGLVKCNSGNLNNWCKKLCSLVKTANKPDKYNTIAEHKHKDFVFLILSKKNLNNFIHSFTYKKIFDLVGKSTKKGVMALSFMVDLSSYLVILSNNVPLEDGSIDKVVKFYISKLNNKQIKYDYLSTFDHIIWLNDFSYKNNYSESQAKTMIKEKKYTDYNKNDIFSKMIMDKHIFINFKETEYDDLEPIYPYKKYDKELDDSLPLTNYWPDRVFWKSLKGSENQLIFNEGCVATDTLGSNHRPLYLDFTLRPRAPGSKYENLVLYQQNSIYYGHKLILSNVKVSTPDGYNQLIKDNLVAATFFLLPSEKGIISNTNILNAENKMCELKFDDDNFIKIYSSDQEYLKRTNLFCAVAACMDNNFYNFGYCSIKLPDMTRKKYSISFDEELEINSEVNGKISGKVEIIELSEKDKGELS